MSISYLKQIEKLQADVAHLKQAASAALELVDIVTAERDALAAQVEVLTDAAEWLASMVTRLEEDSPENTLSEHLKLRLQKCYELLENNAPAACLAQVRVEAVEAFALQVSDSMDDGIDRAKLIILASEYVGSIWQEVK